MPAPLTKKEAKRILGKTDEQLADLLGLTRQGVHRWEDDKPLRKHYVLALHALFPKKIKKPE